MQPDDTAVVEAAIKEISERRLESTEQFLVLHDVRREGGHPVVALVGRGPDATWNVTFEIVDVPYYLTVTLQERAGLCVPVIAMSTPGSTVDFVVRSNEVTPDSVTRILGLSPAVVRVKGELRTGQRTAYAQHEWCYVPDVHAAEDPRDKITHLLHDLGNVSEKLTTISDRIEAELRVWYEGYKNHAAFLELTERQVQVLATLRASFLVNCVLSGPDSPTIERDAG